MEIRSSTTSYSHLRRKKDKFEITLLKDIENIDSRSDIGFELLHKKKFELEKVRKEKPQGPIIRSRPKWVEEGEKPSFLNKTI